MTSQTQAAGADTSEQAVVAGVFSDHSAGMAALEKLRAMGAQLREAGVTGVLILAKDADGKVDARSCLAPRRAPRSWSSGRSRRWSRWPGCRATLMRRPPSLAMRSGRGRSRWSYSSIAPRRR